MDNKKFELNDEMMDEVTGGVSMSTILSMGTKVTAKNVTCPMCGTSHGVLGTMFGVTGIVCCGSAHEKLYEQNQIGMDAVLVMNPTTDDYTLGW